VAKQVVVLGMHRSLTSGVAEGLHRAGIHMGEEMLGKTKSQPTGHWEDKEFLHLNEQLLEAAGGSWRNPPSRAALHAIAGQFERRIQRMIAKRNAAHDPWGWKDPRNGLTLPLYLPHLDGDVHLVAVFRKPERVARSLESRNSIPRRRGLGLARAYNDRILQEIDDFLEYE